MKAVVKKQQTVDALVESFNGATAVYLLNYQGMSPSMALPPFICSIIKA